MSQSPKRSSGVPKMFTMDAIVEEKGTRRVVHHRVTVKREYMGVLEERKKRRKTCQARLG